MSEMPERILSLLQQSLPAIGTALAVLSTVIGTVLAYYFSAENFRAARGEIEKTLEVSIPVQTRLNDARAALRKQMTLEIWSRRANGCLQFGQYIIGGVLATSAVQDNVSRGIVSFLGVLVLISSLIHQQYRPDIRLYGAKRRTVQLNALVRHAEDCVYEIEQQLPGAQSVTEVRKMISSALSQIEASELTEYEPKGGTGMNAQPRASADAVKRRR